MTRIAEHLQGLDPPRTLQWLADRLGLSRNTVKNWKTIPVKRAVEIQRLTDGAISIHVTRPDIFGTKQNVA